MQLQPNSSSEQNVPPPFEPKLRKSDSDPAAVPVRLTEPPGEVACAETLASVAKTLEGNVENGGQDCPVRFFPGVKF